jgi:hypothetical protein
MWKWKRKEEKKGEKKGEEKGEEKQESLLKELCGDDAKLYGLLSNYLKLDPSAAISKKGLDILIEEGERSGNFRPAVDKVLFEGSQNPGGREGYIEAIQNLALKTIHATEQEKEKVEKEGLTDRAASLGSRIEDQKFMSERAEDVLNVASKFYNERLVELGESVSRDAREEVRRTAEFEERRIGRLEKEGRETSKRERRGMGRAERREAEKRDKAEELAAEDRREARGEERREAERKEQRTGELEEAGREARERERRGD